MREFTPGNWIVSGHYVADQSKKVICQLPDKSNPNGIGISYKESMRINAPNGKLIAAAPELLNALHEYIAEWDYRHGEENHRTGITTTPESYNMAKEAIKKATS